MFVVGELDQLSLHLHLDGGHLSIEETRLVRRLPGVLATVEQRKSKGRAKEEQRRRYTLYTRYVNMGDLLCATAHLHHTHATGTTHDRE